MHVEQQECHEEESRRCDEFEAAQEEHFRVVHKHLTAHDNSFNSFASYAIEKFNEIRQNMTLNPGET